MNQSDVTPVKKQTTLDLIFEGINDIKASMNELQIAMLSVEQRVDSARDLASRADKKAGTALWMRSTWAPFIASAIALGLSAVALGKAFAH